METWINQRGGIFILYTPQLPDADRALLLTAARVVIDPARGRLPMQIEALRRSPGYLPAFAPERNDGAGQGPADPLARLEGLLFDNGLGGFTPDGREYLVYLAPGQHTPAPWVNVLANPEFGSLVTESGSSCTWAVNSGENRLTPWSNDPVTDPSGEILYLRDEETGEVWSHNPGAMPRGRALPGASRPGLHHLRAQQPRPAAAAAAVRRGKRAGEDRPAAGGEYLGPAATHHGHLLRRVGARRQRAKRRSST